MTEPTPPTDEADVSDRVLDELKLVFGGAPDATADEPSTGPASEPGEPTQASEPTQLEPTQASEPIQLEPTQAVEAMAPTQATVLAGPGLDAGPQPSNVGLAAARTTIVIGGDDSLPDAVYLDDGELVPLSVTGDDGTGRNTIIIGNELDSSGAFDAVAVPSRSMDPRVRARRVAVKRARGRKRLLWAGVIVVVLLIGVAALAVFSSSLFAVDTVDVQGATYTQYYDGEELQAIVDDLHGQPVLLIDTLAAERKLEAIPWIERAFVRTDFPDRVFIDVRERRPLATFVGSDGKYRVIDRDGRVMAVLDGRPTDYMLLTGPAPDVDAGGVAGAPFASAAQMVSALPAEIRSLAVSASVDATTGDLGLVMLRPVSTAPDSGSSADTTASSTPDPDNPDDVINVRVGNATNLDAKLARLLQLIRDGLDGVVRIDVSTNEASVTKEK